MSPSRQDRISVRTIDAIGFHAESFGDLASLPEDRFLVTGHENSLQDAAVYVSPGGFERFPERFTGSRIYVWN